MPLSSDAAETVALQALAWLIANDELLPVFQGATGASEQAMRAGATDPAFLRSVLDFLTIDDAWVIAFCDSAGVGYDQPLIARAVLAGPSETHWTGEEQMRYQALLFDKDGTLFEFAATWNSWARQVIRDLSEGDADLAQRIADTIRYDLSEAAFFPDSAVIAGTNRQAAEAVACALPHRSVSEIEAFLMQSAAEAPLAPVVPLSPFLQGLQDMGYCLGVMTNDTEFGARTQLQAAGVLGQFDFVAGFDSGYGAKPAPDPLLAFCNAVAVQPAAAVMVGDSTHDLIAGRAAGMATVGVLTGMAGADTLSPLADVVLPDIGHLPLWLQQHRPHGMGGMT